MAVVRSKLNQRIIVNLMGGKNLDLPAKETVEISDQELDSPHIAALISQGDLLVIRNENISLQPQNRPIAGEVEAKTIRASLDPEVKSISNHAEKTENELKDNIKVDQNLAPTVQPQISQNMKAQNKITQSKPTVKATAKKSSTKK